MWTTLSTFSFPQIRTLPPVGIGEGMSYPPVGCGRCTRGCAPQKSRPRVFAGPAGLRRVAPYPAQAHGLNLRCPPLSLEWPGGGLAPRCPESRMVFEQLVTPFLDGVVSDNRRCPGPALGLAAGDDALRKLVQVLAVTEEGSEQEPVSPVLAQSLAEVVQ